MFESVTSGRPTRARAARALLAQRGLTDEVVRGAQSLLAELTTLEAGSVPAPSEEEQRRALAQAQTALWNWYLEWSLIVRRSLKDRTLLRSLGFLRKAGGGTPAEADE